eukprot:TRINITY_DN13610_c0_g2_i1.p1 TRINITY_DN13610_c0_g2~~TRINITY_DN13610_c0_g2_i1.p1  ORF type:complete len:185 (-),score=36.18 TRINITY_DN13610_c0_g2_i1:64-549(-)
MSSQNATPSKASSSVQPRWFYREDGLWHAYRDDMNLLIEALYLKAATGPASTQERKIGAYSFDFAKRKSNKDSASKAKKIRRSCWFIDIGGPCWQPFDEPTNVLLEKGYTSGAFQGAPVVISDKQQAKVCWTVNGEYQYVALIKGIAFQYRVVRGWPGDNS